MSELTDKLRRFGADVNGAMERFMDDEELYALCLASFFEDPAFAGLADALSRGSVQEAFDCGHSLKGVAGNLGLTPLYEKISILVDILRSDRLPDGPKYYQDILDSRQALKKIMEK